jgi:hypothetical protein
MDFHSEARRIDSKSPAAFFNFCSLAESIGLEELVVAAFVVAESNG